MAIPSIRWLRRIAIAIAAIVALAVPVFPKEVQAIAAVFAAVIRALPAFSVTAILVEIAVAATLMVLAVIWWLWWRFPRWQVTRLSLKIRDPKARADVEDNFRKTVGQALGGAAVLIGAVAAYLQFTQQQQASRDLLISNQVSKGFEQLASDKITERLGGIYALEGVMNTSDQYHKPVLEALCAFVRDSTKDVKIPTPDPKTGHVDIPQLATDVQAALTVIGRRSPGAGRVDLVRANIPGAVLPGARLEVTNLIGVHLEGAMLVGAHLKSAMLTGAHLENANLFLAHLEGAAQLNGAHLECANLAGAHLEDTSFWGVHLEGADLKGADGLTQRRIDGAFGDAATELPEGLTRPEKWTAAPTCVPTPTGIGYFDFPP